MATRYLTVAEVIHLHHQGMLTANQSAALASPAKLESAVLRPQAEALGEEFYPTIAQKAVALLQGIVIAHAFVDGNKRAGLLSMLAFLRLNGVSPLADQDKLYDFVIAVTTGELREVEAMAAELRVMFTPQLD